MMKLKEANLRELNPSAYTANRKILAEFAESDMDCAEVLNYPQQDPYTCASSLNQSIKTYKMGYKAIVRNRRVYLVKNTKE